MSWGGVRVSSIQPRAIASITSNWSVRRALRATDDCCRPHIISKQCHARTDSMTRNSDSVTATTAVLAAAAAATFTVGVALGARFASAKSKSPKQHLCECGFDLTNCHSNQQIERHMQSTLHKSNLKRSRGAPLLLTGKINEYRAAITTHVDPDDIVLEVGCAEGLTTQRLAQRCKVAIGLDLYERLITRARRRIGKPPENIDGDRDDAVDVHPVDAPEGRGWSNLHFHTADALDKEAVLQAVNKALGFDEEAIDEAKKSNKAYVDALIASEMDNNSTATDAGQLSRKEKRILRRAAIEKHSGDDNRTPSTGRLHSGKVTKIWIDLSGSRETRTVVQAIDQLEAMFQPKLIVVKSDKLKNLVRRCYLSSSIIPGISHDPITTAYVIN